MATGWYFLLIVALLAHSCLIYLYPAMIAVAFSMNRWGSTLSQLLSLVLRPTSEWHMLKIKPLFFSYLSLCSTSYFLHTSCYLKKYSRLFIVLSKDFFKIIFFTHYLRKRFVLSFNFIQCLLFSFFLNIIKDFPF